MFRLKEIKISGNQQVASKDIISLIGIGKNIFLFNSAKVKSDISKKYLYIETLKIKKEFPDKLSAQVTERTLSAVWCFNDSPCFNTDRNGVIFEELSELPYDYIIIKDFRGGDSPVLGNKIIEPVLLASIRNIAEKTSEWGITPETLTILSRDRLNLKIVDSGEIYFNLQSDLDWQLDKLKAVLGQEIPREKRKNLQYIDLRFCNLAAYKYR